MRGLSRPACYVQGHSKALGNVQGVRGGRGERQGRDGPALSRSLTTKGRSVCPGPFTVTLANPRLREHTRGESESEVGSIGCGWVARGVVRQAHQKRWVRSGGWVLLGPRPGSGPPDRVRGRLCAGMTGVVLLGPPFDKLRAGSSGTPGCGSTRPAADSGPAHHER